jgi:NAD(P)-dependent dehydrogenase (short-subunit alcohol dehydrogenase family)
MDLGLTDAVVVITGGAGAICTQIARRFAQEGARPVLVDVHAPAPAVQIEGRDVPVVACDVTRDQDVRRMAEDVAARFGRVDVLVNGAGVMTWTPIVDLPEEEWDRVVDISLKGTYLVTRAIAPHMMHGHGGKIVNIASGLGHTPIIEVGHYAAAKAGVIALTKTLALELAPHRITVNAVAPGAIDTPLIWPRRSRQDIDAIGARIPLGRVGQPDDVAKVVVFLASTGAEYMTGQTLFINGGALMP